VITISANDTYWGECLACQIRAYATADIVIGLHGAGITNMMFMPPGSLVVEIVGQFDGRMTPLCGYHGPLAAIYGAMHAL
jgi:capsular polysaccharide biosynthesis protein